MRRTAETTKDYEKVTSFLTDNDKELAVPVSQFPGGIEKTIETLSEKGKIIIAEKGEEIFGLLGITFGEPSKNYKNSDIGYLYLLLLDTQNRRKKGVILGVFQKIIEEMKEKGIKKIRFKADTNVDYNNTLYRKFANIINTQKNTQGIDCNLYEADVDELYQSLFIDRNIRPLRKNNV